MKKFIKLQLLAIAVVFYSCGSGKMDVPTAQTVDFTVNLNDRSNDTFKVEVAPPVLSEDNNIYQFAATAPGTYQVMDIGRYVTSFAAFDKNGNEIGTKHLSTNQFELSTPEKIAKIEYQISETWDTPVEVNPIYLMCGTSIENDHTLINGQAVFGYFKGMQGSPLKIRLDYPEKWHIGTALTLSSDGTYWASDYDKAVDSPILLGNLTKASLDVQGTNIDVYTYSKTSQITSNQVLETLKNMLLSASGFLNGLPVKHYTFLFVFEDKTAGAWEHSYSSEYIYKEAPWKDLKSSISHVTAHEFFHVVTPLNLHSQIIAHFNFITPVPSEHLWLYEGTTEWASNMMLFRSGQNSMDEYFKNLERKITIDTRHFDQNYSLVKISETSYTPEGNKQYGNIYMKGALVAGLLNIRLLELSNGKIGLVDVIKKLTKEYGPDKPFDDASFFGVVIKATYPEIKDFIDKYIEGTVPLPITDYYQKLGIDYDADQNKFSLMSQPTKDQLKLRKAWMKPIKID
ncbi:hypothetical protein K8352_03980 [Flavobacteriaceae bacterium F89]|uniref:Peptidase n=1 Tax=Cerina litoralis TaxID=2874477 RepID=A0AAE3ETM7_9FLAO|nr:hypothetical protein [Cerina litoralis]MCG2459894.1 hypothetical protein [Cerina litoralis]